jgi:ribose-phosphate pyrophosphokinase
MWITKNKQKSRFGDLKLMILNSHKKLGEEVAQILNVEPLLVESDFFGNNEIAFRRLGDVSGGDVCIFSSLHSGYDTVKELRLACNSLKSSSPNRVFGVLPFVPYGKSDHATRFGDSIGYAVTTANISESGLEAIAIFDQHSAQHPYFFDTSHHRLHTVHHLYMMRILIEFAQQNLEFDAVSALDQGSYKRNAKIADFMGIDDVSFVLKARNHETKKVDIENSKIIGDVKDKVVIGFDDMIQRGSTLETSAKILKKNGAKKVYFSAVHNDFTKETFDVINPLLETGLIDKLIVIETIPLLNKEKWNKNLIVLSPAKFLAKVIDYIHMERHQRELFLDIQ